MENTLDVIFLNTYKPLLDKFMSNITSVKKEFLPVPFLPYYGVGFEKSPYKIAFVGWETRDSDNLIDFVNAYNSQSDEVYYWFREHLERPFYFLDSEYKYLNNSGRDFWGFVLQFFVPILWYRWEKIKRKIISRNFRKFCLGQCMFHRKI